MSDRRPLPPNLSRRYKDRCIATYHTPKIQVPVPIQLVQPCSTLVTALSMTLKRNAHVYSSCSYVSPSPSLLVMEPSDLNNCRSLFLCVTTGNHFHSQKCGHSLWILWSSREKHKNRHHCSGRVSTLRHLLTPPKLQPFIGQQGHIVLHGTFSHRKRIAKIQCISQ